MLIIERTSSLCGKHGHKKAKSQRANISKYNALIIETKKLGVISIEFDHNFSYERKIKILEEIIKLQKQ